MTCLRAAIMALLLLCAASLFAWEWPVDNVQPTAFFAQPEGDVPYPGIRLRASEVTSVHDGRVVLVDRQDQETALVVVDHGDGFRVAYDGLELATLAVVSGRRIRQGDQIGLAVRGTVGLRVFDAVHERTVNPLLVLPDYVDRFRPVIEGLRLVAADGATVEISGSERRPAEPGRYQLQLSVFDRISFTGRLQVYGIEVFVNGRAILAARLDAIEGVDGERVLAGSPELALSSLLRSGFSVHAGEVDLLPGEATVDVVAYDFIGNRARARFVLSVESQSEPTDGS